MKNASISLTFCLLLCALSTEVFGQYTPLLEDGKYWVSIQHLYSDSPSPVSGVALELLGDTMLNDQTYKKVYRHNLAGSHPCPSGPCFQLEQPYRALNTQLECLLREDIAARKVYLLPLYESEYYCATEEYLLFDFSLNAGDTLHDCAREQIWAMEQSPDLPTLGIVDSIGTMDVNQIPRRSLFTTGNITWISLPVFDRVAIVEGVGYADSDFLRLREHQFVEYCEGGPVACQILTSSYTLAREIGIKIYPNPSTGIYRVEVAGQSPDRYSVYSIDGRLQLEQAGREILDLGTLANGIYLLEVQLPNGTRAIERLVKNN